MSKLRLYIAIALGVLLAPQALCENYPIRGRVIDRLTRRGVAYAAVVIVGQGTKGASADAEGEFVIEGVAPGIYRLEASMLGYKTTVTPEYLVSAATPFIEIEMDEESQGVDAVTVRPTPFRRTVESPVSMNVIGTGISAQVYINLPNGGNQASVDISPNFNSRRITLRGELLPLSEGNIFQGRTF